MINEVRITGKRAAERGAKELKVVARGDNLREDADVTLGEGIRINERSAPKSGGSLSMVVDVDEDAPLGERTLTVTGGDCSTASYPNAITVEEARARA